MKGKHRSNEAKEKSSRTQKGRSYSGSFKKGHDGYWKDKHLSDEHRQKMSMSSLGHEVSEEVREKLRIKRLKKSSQLKTLR